MRRPSLLYVHVTTYTRARLNGASLVFGRQVYGPAGV